MVRFTGWRIRTAEVCEFRELRGYYFNVLSGRPVEGDGPLNVFVCDPFTWPIRVNLDRPFDWSLDMVSGELDPIYDNGRKS